MTLLMSVCADCGATYFPARLRCHRCGSYRFLDQPVDSARVSGVVPVHRAPEDCPWHCLVELQTEAGVTVMAVAQEPPTLHSLVPLIQQADGAVVIPPR
ncbi:zinc ribbon domain-containing protein [Curvibacter cyanobacteriorum]|uniref:zinc ribbon domain-containing protein n=1 Tax=Curvibacter cyanobacteriorum TaxID=3026422 RepID=UPI00390836C4